MERPTNPSILEVAGDRAAAEEIEVQAAHSLPSSRTIPSHRQSSTTSSVSRRRKKKQYVSSSFYVLLTRYISLSRFLFDYRYAVSTAWEREVAEGKVPTDINTFLCCFARRIGHMFAICSYPDGTPILIAGPCWPFCALVTGTSKLKFL